MRIEAINKEIIDRIDDLVEEGNLLREKEGSVSFLRLGARAISEASKSETLQEGAGELGDKLNAEREESFVQWQTSGEHTMRQLFTGENESVHLRNFMEATRRKGDRASVLVAMLGVLKAVQADCKGGYLFQLRDEFLVEMSADRLEQAKYFLEKSDDSRDPAQCRALAVFLAGCTLETGLRELCRKNHIEIGETSSIDKMLKKLKRPLGLCPEKIKELDRCKHLRDPNAHGDWKKLNREDVDRMIGCVGDFLAQLLR